MIGRPRHSAEYTAYLASPAWQQVRLHALQGAGWRCEACGVARAAVRWLEVNHKHYRTPFGHEQWPRDLVLQFPFRLPHLARVVANVARATSSPTAQSGRAVPTDEGELQY